MKRIFLTSGLVLCMACPAFATLDGSGQSWNGATSGEQTGGCDDTDLGVYYGETTLQAQWAEDFAQMVLNENDGTTTATGGSASGNTTAPALFLTPYNGTNNTGVGVYTRSGSNTANDPYVFTRVAASGQALTANTGIPAGIPVQYNVTTDLPSGATGSASTVTSTIETRAFEGYFATAARTDTTALISSTGVLTEAGRSEERRVGKEC